MHLTEVAIIIDHANDMEHIRPCKEYLDHFGIRYDVQVLSAMRDPDALDEYVDKGPERGIKLFIVAAGMGAQSAGVIASKTYVPVIGVPLSTTDVNGVDALYAMVQMTEGVPVATVSIGIHGLKNAAVLAAEILSLSDARLKERLRFFKQNGCKFA